MINLPIGQILMSSGLITKEQLESALEHQKVMKGVRLGDILLHLKYIDELQYLQAISERVDVPFYNSLITEVEELASRLISIENAKKYQVMPLKVDGGKIHLLMNDPLDFYTIDDLHIITGYQIKPLLSTRDNIIRSIDLSYHNVKKRVQRNDVCSSDDLGQILSEILYVLHGKYYKDVEAKQNNRVIDIKITL